MATTSTTRPVGSPPARESAELENGNVAALLDRVASLLEAQHAEGFRVRAWRHAADQCRRLRTPLSAMLARGGPKALEEIPGVGPSIAGRIAEFLGTGRCAYLDRLEGETEPEDLFRTLPGVGPELAARIHEALHVETLEELEVSAHDGRLGEVPGLGARRCEAIRDALSARLAWRRPIAQTSNDEPPVWLLLEIDDEYRLRSAQGTLRGIAPRRFNPQGKAWLPIWHVDREGWHLTVLFSNTALAHRLGRTRDWVVLYAAKGAVERRYTVVTERRGTDAGNRVVRGREAETRESRPPHHRGASEMAKVDAQYGPDFFDLPDVGP